MPAPASRSRRRVEPARVHVALAVIAAALFAAPPSIAQSPARPSRDELARLPRDGGPEWNRLVFQASPFLREHARDAVDWYPWGAEAFERAAKESKPVFLSIGYASSHACRSLGRESFQDAAFAAFLNEHYVCVLVDREERPDVDEVYVRFCATIRGSAGWPLVTFLTPDRAPFQATTYLPREDHDGVPGLATLARTIARAWSADREGVVEHAGKLVEIVRDEAAPSPGVIDAAAVSERAAAGFAQVFDAAQGGFGPPPRFPSPQSLRFLLDRAARGDAKARTMAETTLDAIACGGLHDHAGGGFHPSTRDAAWRWPRFEKRLCDQALVGLAFVEAWLRTGRDEWKLAALDAFGYALGALRLPNGGFAASEDSEVGGIDGAAQLWTLDELARAAGGGDRAAGLRWAELLGATEAGTFVDEAAAKPAGRNVLALARPYRAVPTELRPGGAVLQRVRAARAARARPRRDETVLTDWNGLAIAALARGAAAFGDPALLEGARGAANFALAELRRSNGLLWKRHVDGGASGEAVADDYAFLAWGLVELYEADLDPRWLAEAARTMDMLAGQFQDGTKSALSRTSRAGEALVLRVPMAEDSTVPSVNAAAATTFLRLGTATGQAEYDAHAHAILEAFGGAVEAAPTFYPELLRAFDLARGPRLAVVVTGDPTRQDTQALLRCVQSSAPPDATWILVPTGAEDPVLTRTAPWTKEFVGAGPAAAAVVCRGSTREAPITDLDLLRRRLARAHELPAPPK